MVSMSFFLETDKLLQVPNKLRTEKIKQAIKKATSGSILFSYFQKKKKTNIFLPSVTIYYALFKLNINTGF